VYALDIMLDIEPGTDKATLEQAMEDHTLDQAQLMCIYSR
jgi:phosphatidylethanolamine-binding protein (PEBP) family uncharacterized protein